MQEMARKSTNKKSRLDQVKESRVRFEEDEFIDKNSRKDLFRRIKSLEEQNANLREELYYLREALLINFQNRRKV